MATTHRRPPAPQPELYRFAPLDFAALATYVAIAGDLHRGRRAPGTGCFSNWPPPRRRRPILVNLVFYGLVAVLAFLAARRVVVRDLRVLATRPVVHAADGARRP